MLATNPYIEDCHVGLSVGGDINVNVKQRVPILHLYYGTRSSIWTKKAPNLPLSSEGVADVLVGKRLF